MQFLASAVSQVDAELHRRMSRHLGCRFRCSKGDRGEVQGLLARPSARPQTLEQIQVHKGRGVCLPGIQPSVRTQSWTLNKVEMVSRRVVSLRFKTFLAALLASSKVITHLPESYLSLLLLLAL